MKWQVIKIRIQKVLAYTVTAVLFLLISAFLILQIPPVQNYFIGKFLKDFTQVTGFTTTIKSFRMLWFDRLELQDVSVFDPANNQMIRAGEIQINFKISQLWENKNVNIAEIADEMEFTSRSFFTRYVKKLLGVTPTEYRERMS